jgi:hypothetical protein
MDQELLSICTPPHTAMRDYSQVPSIDLGVGVTWSAMVMGFASDGGAGKIARATQTSSAARLEREARLSVYFFEAETGC